MIITNEHVHLTESDFMSNCCNCTSFHVIRFKALMMSIDQTGPVYLYWLIRNNHTLVTCSIN